jgi:hypothetical protein
MGLAPVIRKLDAVYYDKESGWLTRSPVLFCDTKNLLLQCLSGDGAMIEQVEDKRFLGIEIDGFRQDWKLIIEEAYGAEAKINCEFVNGIKVLRDQE